MSGGTSNVRDAAVSDAEACLAIYAPYVTDTAITFETSPPLPAEMAMRIATAVRTHAWVVLESERRVPCPLVGLGERRGERGRICAGHTSIRSLPFG
ncbi:MAG: family acetyltransferase [Pseudonocardiales bacterium]|jgi:L-amino acid N-acyltransferase YncA|nr:family acetyltransferase [Pseudonocardiales bacterium]